MKLPPVLENARSSVVPAMDKALAELSSEIRIVVDYHMGWRNANGQPVQQRGSKSVRPALALLSAQAAGADPEVALPGAIAVEFLHNCAFLLDDIMDGDRFRRQRPTAWVVFGQGLAICAGVSLLTLGHKALLEASSPHRAAAGRLYVDTTTRMLGGQALDLTFEQRSDVAMDECLAMTTSKTASLLSCATSIGAVLAGAPAPTVKLLTEFGTALGIAFQARDDMLGIWGRPEQTGGRPPGFDLRARKGTLPIVAALAGPGPAAAELRGLLGSDPLTDDDVARCAELVTAAGGRESTASLARDMVHKALAAADALGADEQVRQGLIEVARLGLPDDV